MSIKLTNLFKHSKEDSSASSDDAAAEGRAASEQEDGEIDDRPDTLSVHPMVTLTKIDPKDIPEVSNKYLMRGADRKAASPDKAGEGDDDRDDDRRGRGRNRSGAKEKPTLVQGEILYFSVNNSIHQFQVWLVEKTCVDVAQRSCGKRTRSFRKQFELISIGKQNSSLLNSCIFFSVIELRRDRARAPKARRRRIGSKRRSAPSSCPNWRYTIYRVFL